MTPKEKAKNLVDKFSEYAHTDFVYIRGGYQAESQLQNAKQCALIAVDEILNYDIKAKCESQFIIEQKIESYWQEVKQEIEKL
jgi:hypothetical protein